MTKPTMAPADPAIEDAAVKPGGVEDLVDIAREADLLDTAPAAAAQASQAAEVEAITQSNEAELLVTLQTIRAMVFPLLGMVTPPEKMQQLASVWHDGVLQASASAGALVMEKHGWSMGSLMGDYGCYVMLAAALAPPVIMTRKILAEPKEKPKEGAAQEAPAVDG